VVGIERGGLRRSLRTSPHEEASSHDWIEPVLQTTRKKCWAIRNRVYPREVWPDVLHLKSLLSFASKDRVLLEIGCGRDARQLRKMAPSFGRAIGLDLEVGLQADPSSGCALLCADAHETPLRPNSVDVIACGDALEHFRDPETVFAECARVLAPGGRMVVTTVNKFFPPVLLGRLLPHRVRRFVNRIVSGTEGEDTYPTYYRANTPRELRRLAARAGFTTVSIRYVSHHPIYFLFSVTIYRIAVFFEQIVRRHDRLGCLRHLIHATFQLDLPGKHAAAHSRRPCSTARGVTRHREE